MPRKNDQKPTEFNNAYVHYCTKIHRPQELTKISRDGIMETTHKDPIAYAILEQIELPKPPSTLKIR